MAWARPGPRMGPFCASHSPGRYRLDLLDARIKTTGAGDNRLCTPGRTRRGRQPSSGLGTRSSSTYPKLGQQTCSGLLHHGGCSNRLPIWCCSDGGCRVSPSAAPRLVPVALVTSRPGITLHPLYGAPDFPPRRITRGAAAARHSRLQFYPPREPIKAKSGVDHEAPAYFLLPDVASRRTRERSPARARRGPHWLSRQARHRPGRAARGATSSRPISWRAALAFSWGAGRGAPSSRQLSAQGTIPAPPPPWSLRSGHPIGLWLGTMRTASELHSSRSIIDPAARCCSSSTCPRERGPHPHVSRQPFPDRALAQETRYPAFP